jgi:leader peptidase (prepilin peptidase)/N-methyltransferase
MFMTATIAVALGAVGLAVGWLLDPVITRVPRRQPVIGPADDAEPEAPHTARQVTVTVVCGVLFAALGARFDDSWALPAYLVLATALVALSAIDLEHYILPNRIVYPLAPVMIVLLAIASVGDDDLDAFVRALIAGVVAFVVFFVLHLVSPRSMGFGDVKLAFVLGLSLGWLGWGEVLLGLFLGFVYGAVVGVVLIALRLRARNEALPFGPFLAAGALTAVLVGDAIITWYRGG